MGRPVSELGLLQCNVTLRNCVAKPPIIARPWQPCSKPDTNSRRYALRCTVYLPRDGSAVVVQ
jgi:hypothetical protein